MDISPIPAGLHSLTPSLTVSPCADAIEFYKEAFGATERGDRMTGPDGNIAHAEIEIAGSVIMVADDWPDGPTKSPSVLGGSTMALFLYDADAPAIWQRAIDAGAEIVYPYELQFYGDEGGRIRDPFGHTWGIGRRVEDVDDEEMERRAAAFYEEQA